MIYYKQYGPIDSQKSKSFNFESKDIKRDNPSILNAKIQKPRKFKNLKAKVAGFLKKHKKIEIIFGLIIVLSIVSLIILLSQPSQKDSSKNTKSWSEELTSLSQ